ncbi:MAG: VCBS repeat-containing protein [Polyangiales bacterium]|nr:VCBS repeat-containing protein [Myxococcales bacterium]MCB9657296.1 VCBS repeat-containing protein [Sandaracinaceae bacterium]
MNVRGAWALVLALSAVGLGMPRGTAQRPATAQGPTTTQTTTTARGPRTTQAATTPAATGAPRAGAATAASGPPPPGGAGAAQASPTWLTPIDVPAWLDQGGTLMLVHTAPREARAAAPLAALLQRALVPGVPAGRIRVGASADVSPVSLAAAARQAGHDAVLGVSLSLEAQRVRVEVVLVDLRATPATEHESRFTGPLDAFFARVVGGPPAVRGSAVRARHLRFQAAALLGLAAIDVDGDGRDELAVAREPHVTVYSVVQEGSRLRLVRRGRAGWPAAARRVPFARRAEAWFSVQGGRVLVSRSDRQGEHALSLQGDVLRFEPLVSDCPGGLAFADGCAHWVAGRDYFDGMLSARRSGTASAAAASDDVDDETDADDSRARAPRFYTRTLHTLRQADGALRTFEALVTPHGALVGQVAGQRASIGGQGAALAGADIDADGSLDLLTSDYTRDGQEDRLRWFRLGADGRITLVWEGAPARGTILHAAAGDLLGTGRPVFVAFEARAGGPSRLWVVD